MADNPEKRYLAEKILGPVLDPIKAWDTAPRLTTRQFCKRVGFSVAAGMTGGIWWNLLPGGSRSSNEQIPDRPPSGDSRYGVPYSDAFKNRVERVSNRLGDYVFVIDPGHGGTDPGAICEHGRFAGKLIERDIAYDISLRIIQGLIAHGAHIETTHYNPTKGITDTKFPGSERIHKGTDGKYHSTSSDGNIYSVSGEKVGGAGQVSHKARSSMTRSRTIQRRKPKEDPKLIYISVHCNSLDKKKTPEFDKSLGTMFYVTRQESAGSPSSLLANEMTNHMYSPNSRPFRDDQGIGFLKSENQLTPAEKGYGYGNECGRRFLVEFGNLQSPVDGAQLATGEGRQKLADQFVQGLLNNRYL